MSGYGRGRAGRGRGPRPRPRSPPRPGGQGPPRPGAQGPPRPGAQGPPGAQAVPPHGAQPQRQPRPPAQAQPRPPLPVLPPAQPPPQPQGRGRARGRQCFLPHTAAAQPALGRAALMIGGPWHRQMAAALPPTPPPPKVVPEHTEVERDAPRREDTPAGEGSGDVAEVAEQKAETEMTVAEKIRQRGIRRLDYDDVNTEIKMAKTGEEGTKRILITNYFKFKKIPDYHLYLYQVEFNPTVERKREKQRLLAIHEQLGPNLYLAFDGMILFTRCRVQKTPLELHSKRDNDEIVKITIKGNGKVEKTAPDFVQVMNIQLRGALELLGLQQIGRHFYKVEEAKAIDIDLGLHKPQQHGGHFYKVKPKLSVIPGFITAIKYHQDGLLLGVDVAHKVLRSETAWDILQGLGSNEEKSKAFLGCIILTRYNNRTYKIHDVAFDKNPRSTFKLKDGSVTSFVHYFKNKYNLDIKDHEQSLLVVKPKVKDIEGGRTDEIFLVPELCQVTGLTDELRSDQKLMSKVASAARVDPAGRIQKLLKFQRDLCEESKTRALLEAWEIVPEDDLLETEARVLSQQIVEMRTKEPPKMLKMVTFDAERPNWSGKMKDFHMSLPVCLSEWIVCYASQDRRKAQAIVETVRQNARGMGMDILPPRLIETSSSSKFVDEIREKMHPDVQMVMAVVGDRRKDIYNSIKKVCCLEKPCPSQVVCAKFNPKHLGGICSKIAIQMNCKIGGAPWTVQMPLEHAMYIGIDTFHDSAHEKKSAVGFVATLDQNMTEFYCNSSIQLTGQELSHTLKPLVKAATEKFIRLHRRKPREYIIYRDGVGDGMLRMVHKIEMGGIVAAIEELHKDTPDQRPLIYFFVVKKRILTRLFTQDKRNPPPGTVVDKDITTKFWFDFFLISQSVAQGTVSPVHYNCISMPSEELSLKADDLQQMTYKMCHLYYNWAGTIRVPSVCMYAHKLAFLVGQSLHRSPEAKLRNSLFFL